MAALWKTRQYYGGKREKPPSFCPASKKKKVNFAVNSEVWRTATVEMKQPFTSLVIVSLSGSDVIVSVDTGGFHVVGVDMGTRDNTISPPPIKKSKTGGHAVAQRVKKNSESLATSLHGHTAACLICEVAR
eukprot:gene41535-56193_t